MKAPRLGSLGWHPLVLPMQCTQQLGLPQRRRARARWLRTARSTLPEQGPQPSTMPLCRLLAAFTSLLGQAATILEKAASPNEA